MNLSWIIGLAKTSFYHSSDTFRVTLKDGTEQSFSELCKEVIPRCWLNPFLFNGHLQTIWTFAGYKAPELDYKRLIFESDSTIYPGSFAVDFVVHESSQGDDSLPERTTYFTREERSSIGSMDSTPMLVVLPGLSGGSYERYVRQVLGPVTEAREWAACVVNSRGCAKSKITSGVLYNARATWDVRQVVGWLRNKFPNRPLFGLGFSIGANILTIVRIRSHV